PRRPAPPRPPRPPAARAGGPPPAGKGRAPACPSPPSAAPRWTPARACRATPPPATPSPAPPPGPGAPTPGGGRRPTSASTPPACASRGRAGPPPRGAWPTSAWSSTPPPTLPAPVPPRAPGRPPPAMPARYVSGLYPLAEMGPLLRRQAAQVGMEAAAVWVALTDGGSGLEDFVRANFGRPDLVVILDFWHAASYLEELARAVYPGDEGAAGALAGEWCRLLKEEGGALTLAALREWDFGPRRSKGLREQLARVEDYFGANVHRMEYPEYRAEGWQIGSGAVESACKTVVGQRLKG